MMDIYTVRMMRRLGEHSGADVARHAGIDKYRLCQLERGHRKPRPGELERIAEAIGLLDAAKRAAEIAAAKVLDEVTA